MKLLFVLFDGGGNIPPQLQTARALRARGAEIHVLGLRGVRERVETEGFSFEEFSDGRHFDPTTQRPLAVMMAQFAALTADRRLGRCIVDEARRHGVDAVVVDMVFNAAILEVLESAIPTVVFVHCFYRAVQDFASSPVGRLLGLRGIAPINPERKDVLQIVSARADLDPVKGTPPVHHVGVVWQGVPRAATAAPTPKILISLSTCAYAGQRRMLKHILEAVEPLPVEAIVTVGPSIDASALRVPPNASIHAWLDHDVVLTGASLVVSHGGHSTAMRALSFGVPLITMPANPLFDQKQVGAAVEKAGAGIALPKHAGSKRIRGAIETVLHGPTYREAAARLGEQIRERDGAEFAAQTIQEFIAARPQAVVRQR